jgi:raffinose/stachyose/melibiose transport system permease protein
MNGNILRKNYPVYLLIPALLIYFTFYLMSLIGGMVLSFTDWNMTSSDVIRFNGIQNFAALVSDAGMIIALKNVFIFNLISTFFKTLFGLLLALALNKSFKGRNFYRALFYFPCILSPLVVGYIFSFMYRPEDGIINAGLKLLGLGSIAPDWLGSFDLALYAVIIVEIWMWTGFCSAIILAGLQTIPDEVLEAAAIDGAGKFDVFRYITLPFIIPVLNIVVVLNVIGGFRVFDIVMATTYGGPGKATEVISTMMYKAQATGSLGYAASIGLVQFLIILVIVMPVYYSIRRKEVEV